MFLTSEPGETNQPPSTGAADFNTIMNMLQTYFEGLYEGDIGKLASVFHEDVVLKAPGLRRNRDQWFQVVSQRPEPKAEGHAFAYEILAVEVLGDQAMAKVSVPLLSNHYIDYLGFLRESGTWQIVNKMYGSI